MTESQNPELTPSQINVLEKLLAAGFQFTTFERMTRQLAVEKSGFIALLDPREGKLKLFGQVGYRVGEGIAMLIEQSGRPTFVYKNEAVAATPELLDTYSRVKAELAQLLNN